MRRNSTRWTSTSQVWVESLTVMPSIKPQTQSSHNFSWFQFRLEQIHISHSCSSILISLLSSERVQPQVCDIPSALLSGGRVGLGHHLLCHRCPGFQVGHQAIKELDVNLDFQDSHSKRQKTNYSFFADDPSCCRLGVHHRTPAQFRHSLHSHSQSLRPRERNELRWETEPL